VYLPKQVLKVFVTVASSVFLGCSTIDRKNTFFDELRVDNIAYIMIGDNSTSDPEYFREHFWCRKSLINKFNVELCVTNKQSISMLADELFKSKVDEVAGLLTELQPSQLYISNKGEAIAYVNSHSGHPWVSITIGGAIKQNNQWYLKWGNENASDHIDCLSYKYNKMIIELLKNSDKK